jgi:AAA domain (dynein-related subfamily)
MGRQAPGRRSLPATSLGTWQARMVRSSSPSFIRRFRYEDFIEGLRPTVGESGSVSYAVRPGVFREFCRRAAQSGGTFVFVIDEINRAELGAVLGELMMLLEYRDRSVTLPYSQEPFSVPGNVVVLATMNTADRSLALVDFALRRRFHAIAMRPDPAVLSRFLEDRGEDNDVVMRFFELVQTRVADANFAPGHSYWMGDDLTAEGLYRVWRYELQPYLAEYWFENTSQLRDLDDAVAKLLTDEA